MTSLRSRFNLVFIQFVSFQFVSVDFSPGRAGGIAWPDPGVADLQLIGLVSSSADRRFIVCSSVGFLAERRAASGSERARVLLLRVQPRKLLA